MSAPPPDNPPPDNPPPQEPPQRPPVDRHMLEALVCPVTQARLRYDAERQELVSKAAHLAFPIRNGIPIMLVDEAREIE
ncbi:MAG: Trm112 family protein [Rhodobacteraceae bacterium]|nr:Trm112 family protein [Paracoccaceae bacterium]